MEHNTGHPASRVLAAARNDLALLKEQGESSSLTHWNVFTTVVNLFNKHLCPHDFVKALYLAWELTYEKYELNLTALSTIRLYLVSDALECLARQGVRVLGPWKVAVKAVIGFLRYCESNILMKGGFVHSGSVKLWVLDVFCDANLCPDINIRLDMLLIIHVWRCDYGVFRGVDVGERITAGLVQLYEYMNVTHHFIPEDRKFDLCRPSFRVLYSLNKTGHLTETFKKATQQIESLSVGPEARFVARMVELVSGGVVMTMERFQSKTLNAENTMEMLEMALVQLGELVFSKYNVETFCYRGLGKVACVAYIQVAKANFELLPALSSPEFASRCDFLRKTFDRISEVLFKSPKSKTLAQLLMADHKEELVKITGGDFIPQDLAQSSQVAENCPERFLDGLTQTPMESPVLLRRSQVTVDETTLVYLLLQKAPQCPFTRTPLHYGSFCRIPKLHQEIHAWRTTGRLNVDHQEPSSSAGH
ncbi:hypothetical protein Pcinc_029481 [Petrolisthes cinctipes]|uniref:U-box domain-containing protein n=1 Tax=Petrolisthes cinctipes TaxID=88211 RepID=A0AAE1F0R4_PETCI|nr:hypothetical protein Pcinc_029481 [Petrolisthes cinctipes]